MKHEPRYKYDCYRCKFNWCCGYRCACNLHKYPEPPEEIKKAVAIKREQWRNK